MNDLWRNLEDLFDQVANGIAVADASLPEAPLVLVNRSFERITGYEKQQALGRGLLSFHQEESDPRAFAALRGGLFEGEARRVVLRSHRRDGTSFLCEVHLHPFRPEGTLTHFLSVVNDVTSTVLGRALFSRMARLEEAMAPPEDLLAPFIGQEREEAGAPSLALLALDESGRIVSADREAHRLLGAESGSLVGQSLSARLEVPGLFDVLRGSGPKEAEWEAAHLEAGPDRERRPLRARLWRIDRGEEPGEGLFLLLLHPPS